MTTNLSLILRRTSLDPAWQGPWQVAHAASLRHSEDKGLDIMLGMRSVSSTQDLWSFDVTVLLVLNMPQFARHLEESYAW